MSALDVQFRSLFLDSSNMLMTMMVFLAAATLSFSLMAFARVRGSVKKRAARILDDDEHTANPKRSLRYSSLKVITQLLEYTTKYYTGTDDENMKVLRQRLIQAGIYDPRAVGFFFVGRMVLAIGLAVALIILLPMFDIRTGSLYWIIVMIGGVGGYIGPKLYIGKRIAARCLECQLGFPDFMDLLVVCADSGLSMEASLERVGRELGDSYPSLTSNIHMTNLEIRAGRSLKDALERFANRLALDEARSFSTLISQSIELGSSITDALRVYSDDMRHQRLSRAEEKAYALPVKLSLPMMLCIFPALFVVIMLPAIVRLYMLHAI